MLCVIGDLVEDIVVWLPTALSYGTDTPSRIVRTRGGSASNVAVFAATVAKQKSSGLLESPGSLDLTGLLESPGSPCARLIAQVGNDRLGDQLVETLRDAAVDPCVVRIGRTGSIVVIVSPDGERTMITDRAAATELRSAPENWHENVSVLHVPAYSLFLKPLSDAAQQCIQ
ncbi:MAG: carbohydrate kinase family protein [Actinobacteria bacterium]|nr:MAG: carbohydrate kinase family protein [Actinomycetota bacterium]